jgi:hypothetical protein
MGFFLLILSATSPTDLLGCFSKKYPDPCTPIPPTTKQAKIVAHVLDKSTLQPIPGATVQVSELFRNFETYAPQNVCVLPSGIESVSATYTTDDSGIALVSTGSYHMSDREDHVVITVEATKTGFTKASGDLGLSHSSPQSLNVTIHLINRDSL